MKENTNISGNSNLNRVLSNRLDRTQLALEFAENIIATIRESLLILDSELKIVSASRFFYQTFHVTQEQTLGEHIYNLGNGQWNISELINLLRNTLPGNLVIENFEVKHKFEDIGEKVMILNARELIQSIGKERLIFLSIQDITERRQVEQKMQDLNAELEIKASELQQILYITTHDLRSPLVNIQGFNKELVNAIHELSEIIERNSLLPDDKKLANSLLNEDIKESMHYINSSTKKMDNLLNGLLVISRLGRQKLSFKQIDMNGLLTDVLNNFKYEIENRNVEVILGELPDCIGDELQINQLFSNLIGNSIKFLDDNRKGMINITGEKHKGFARYKVVDNGIGIDSDYHKKVFELFHKLDPQKSGIGLGLNIVKQIIDKHKGRIELVSNPGKGTLIAIELMSIHK